MHRYLNVLVVLIALMIQSVSAQSCATITSLTDCSRMPNGGVATPACETILTDCLTAASPGWGPPAACLFPT
jgi:hypothetical protein